MKLFWILDPVNTCNTEAMKRTHGDVAEMFRERFVRHLNDMFGSNLFDVDGWNFIYNSDMHAPCSRSVTPVHRKKSLDWCAGITSNRII